MKDIGFILVMVINHLNGKMVNNALIVYSLDVVILLFGMDNIYITFVMIKIVL